MAENTASAKADETRPGKKQSTSQSDETSFDMNELRELMELVNEQGFTDFEFENENIRVRLSNASAFSPVSHTAPSGVPASAATSAAFPAPASTIEPTLAPAETDEGLHKITSPIVGTFYRSPGPDKDPYVKEGSKVTPESIVCIVE